MARIIGFTLRSHQLRVRMLHLVQPYKLQKKMDLIFERAKNGTLMDVRNAKCTNDRDAQKIRAAIRGKETEINAMLGELIVCGSSRPEIDNRINSTPARLHRHWVLDRVLSVPEPTLEPPPVGS